jgi:hypothetical protein
MSDLVRFKVAVYVLTGIVLAFIVTAGVLFGTGVFTTNAACGLKLWPSKANKRDKQLLTQLDASKHGLPLYWNPNLGVYMARLTIGAKNGAKIWTAVDTGSSRFVVNMYDYDGSGTGAPLADPRDADAKQCTATVTYVSQTSNLQMFTDTLLFPQHEIDWSTLCTGQPVSVSQTVLAIDDFAIGVSKSSGLPGGHNHVNVLGLSAVRTHEKSKIAGKHTYFLPSSCQTSEMPAYESPVVRAAHALLQKRDLPLVWAICFLNISGEHEHAMRPRAFISFGPVRLPCLTPSYTPMVSELQRASSAMGRVPGRYYVIEVEKCVCGDASGSLLPLKGFPKYLLVDTGTTQFLLPGRHGNQNAAALNGLAANQRAYIVLVGGATIPFHNDNVSYNDDNAPVFGVLEDSVARNFSEDLDTGIFGCTAMRDMYIEFDCARQRIGFAPLGTPCVT